MQTNARTLDWGLTEYADAFERQRDYVSKRIEGTIQDTLVFTEHPAVFTIGKRIGAEDNLVWNKQELDREGISVHKTNRGGDITYHGPGQIVGYAIVSLQKSRDLHAFLRDLEEVLIRTLRHYGLETTRRDGKTGIWIGERKIAAMGVAVRRWVTYHGFALNIQPNLEHFGGIVPCGIQAEEGTVTSLKAELPELEVDLAQIKTTLEREFWDVFNNYN